jgi:hypothetical protein
MLFILSRQTPCSKSLQNSIFLPQRQPYTPDRPCRHLSQPPLAVTRFHSKSASTHHFVSHPGLEVPTLPINLPYLTYQVPAYLLCPALTLHGSQVSALDPHIPIAVRDIHPPPPTKHTIPCCSACPYSTRHCIANECDWPQLHRFIAQSIALSLSHPHEGRTAHIYLVLGGCAAVVSFPSRQQDGLLVTWPWSISHRPTVAQVCSRFPTKLPAIVLCLSRSGTWCASAMAAIYIGLLVERLHS